MYFRNVKQHHQLEIGGGAITKCENLKCYQVSGLTVEEILDEFNDRREEFGIAENDIVSISALPPSLGIKVATPTGSEDPKVEVVIVYWSDKQLRSHLKKR
jgi:hypothetical protein